MADSASADLVAEAIKSGAWTEKKDPTSGKTFFYNPATKKTTWNLAKELQNNKPPPSTTSGSPSTAVAAPATSGAKELQNKKPPPSTTSVAPSTAVAAPATRGEKKKTVADVLAEGEWTEKADPKSGKKFYFNKVTKKTTWNLVKELGLEDASPSLAATSVISPAPAAAAAGPMSVEEAVRSGIWQEKKDPTSGKKYYYNATTKKTTWNLAKELGLESNEASKLVGTGGSTNTAKDTPTPTPTTSQMSVEEAIASGTWQEKSDPASGKKYYYNPKTKKTTWNLAAELQMHADVAATPVAAATIGAVKQGDSRDKHPSRNYDPVVALSSGEWVEVKDYQGQAYFINRNTKEQTGDLALYLQIQQAIDESNASSLGAEPTISGANLEAPHSNGSGDLDDWVSMMLHSPGFEQSQERLLRKNRMVTATEKAQYEAEHALKAATEHITQLENQLKLTRKLNVTQGEELHQLQCALFYGLGNAARDYTPPMMHAVDEVGSHHYRGSKAVGATSSSPLRGTVGLQSNSRVNAHSAEEQRIATLEQTLSAVQGHNRKILAELQQEREFKHKCSNCSHCGAADPWQRLLTKANPSHGNPSSPYR